MKTIILSLLLLSNLRCFTQPVSNGSLRDSLLRKSNNQKTAAWIMLGGGAALTLAGGIIFVIDATNSTFDLVDNGEASVSATGGIMIFIGVASAVGSIPLFKASARNKKKAMVITVDTQQIMTPLKGGWVYQYQPAVSIKIPIGRR